MIKVVIDTNILMDAWGDELSYTRKIIDEVIKGNLQAVVSHKIWREYQLILNRLVNNPQHHQLANTFFSAVEMINVKSRVKVVKYDKDDNKFFNCAIDGKADYIISNDSHLWEIGEYQGIKVMRPQDFWAEYKTENGDDAEEWKDWMKSVMGK